jgi:CHAT domain-containing protein/Tfp pilus assembly protein PilF
MRLILSMMFFSFWNLFGQTGAAPGPKLPPEVAAEVKTLEETVVKALSSLTSKKVAQDALPAAEKMYEMRRQHQGDAWWETIDCRVKVDLLRRQASLPVELENLLVEAARLEQGVEGAKNLLTAERALSQLAAIEAKLYGTKSVWRANTISNLAGIHFQQGKYKQAESLVREALVIQEMATGREHPTYAFHLKLLATALKYQGRPLEAELLHRQALVVQEKTTGKYHLEYIGILNGLATSLQDQGKYSEADPLYREAISFQVTLYGKDNEQYLFLLSNLATNLLDQDNFTGSETLLREALAIQEKVTGKQHPQYARCLNNLAMSLNKQNKFSEAEALLREALRNQEVVTGKQHPDYARWLRNLAGNFNDQGKYGSADKLYREAIAIQISTGGTAHPSYANYLGGLADNLQAQGQLPAAESLYQEALESVERVLGKNHPDYATSLNNLATNYRAQGRAAAADPLFREALKIMERVFGKKHSRYAMSLMGLAANLQAQGQAAAAEPLYREALKIREQIVGKSHSSYAGILTALAQNLEAQGRANETETLHRQAIGIVELVFGKSHPDYFTSVNGLAQNLDEQGRVGESEQLHREVMQFAERALGKNHPRYAISKSSLAVNLERQGRVSEAESLYREAMGLAELVLGKNHPQYVTTLNNLAVNLQRQGRNDEAEQLHHEAMGIAERVLGKNHPNYAHSVINLALNLVRGPARREEVSILLREGVVLQRKLVSAANTLTTQQQRQFATQNGVAALILPSTLRWELPALVRDRIVEALLQEQFLSNDRQRQSNRAFQALFIQADVLWKSLWLEQQSLTRQIASRSSRGGLFDRAGEAPMKVLLDRLEANEKKLRQTNPEFAQLARLDEVNLADIERSLARGTALIEFIRYQPYDFEGKDSKKKWGQWSYLAILIQPGKNLEIIPLGDAKPVDTALESMRSAMSSTIEAAPDDTDRKSWKRSEGTVAEASAELRRLIWQPLEKHLVNAKRVYLGPGAMLAQVPFEMLAKKQANGSWRYLVEEKELVYLSTARELGRLSLRRDAATNQNAVLVVNPDFNLTPLQLAQGVKRDVRLEFAPAETAGLTLGAAPATGRQLRTKVPRDWQQFSSLQQFGEAAASYLGGAGWKVTKLFGSAATEEAVTAVEAPRLLQFATHGIVLDAPKDQPDQPLLRSMLFLAGANQTKDDTPLYRVANQILTQTEAKAKNLTAEQMAQAKVEVADGILTALEAGRMNLFGTDLVNLTACETGLGTVSGEGIIGLRQSFLNAGARSITMSLFEVPVEETKAQVTNFYRNWLERKMARYSAFRAAQLESLRKSREKHGAGHPFFWAGTIFAGDPGDLPPVGK